MNFQQYFLHFLKFSSYGDSCKLEYLPPTTKLTPERNAKIFLLDFKKVMMKKNSPVNKKMKERMKYVEEFLAESEKMKI